MVTEVEVMIKLMQHYNARYSVELIYIQARLIGQGSSELVLIVRMTINYAE